MRRLLALLSIFAAVFCARADEPFLKPNDVIAVVGGEDMVVASEAGYLEAIFQYAFPADHLQFRGLAWEGDTVFEQHRDLNYPSLEAQLNKVGATVILAQFGQTESLRGEAQVAAFTTAYEKLLERVSKSETGAARRVIIAEPFAFVQSAPLLPDNVKIAEQQRTSLATKNASLDAYSAAVDQLAAKRHARLVRSRLIAPSDTLVQRDGMHLNDMGQRCFADQVMLDVLGSSGPDSSSISREDLAALRGKVAEKNRLWSQYTRPQNWAFLAGDRTNQPSSRDHLDPSKRWFPAEMEQFVPLIEGKDREIWEAAGKRK